VEKLARSTLALKHNEAQRSSLYHIDNNHLTSAKSPRAPARSGAQCTQYIFILQVKSDRQRKNIRSKNRHFWQQRFGSCSQRHWGRSQGGGDQPDFCDKAKFGESKSKFKCLVIHGVKNPSQDIQCSGERFEETRVSRVHLS